MKKPTKPKAGGTREGAGRKLMYGEKTVRLMFSVPESKKGIIKKTVAEKLKEFKIRR